MAIEAIAEDVVEEVATNLEEVAEATRRINAAGVGYLAVGLGVGALVGFYFGYKYNRAKIRAEEYKTAQAEVDVLRKVYLDKTLAVTQRDEDGDEEPLHGRVPTDKPSIDEVVEGLGYRVEVPARERPLPAPVPIQELPVEVLDDALSDLPEEPVGTSKSMNAGWNYEQELANRTPEAPYIIHQNEFNHSNLNYTKKSYTYYADDDYLVDVEIGRPVVNGDVIVGIENLRFGHGSDDTEVVYVRNDIQEVDMYITRVNRSFEEDELGLHHSPDDSDDDDDDDDIT